MAASYKLCEKLFTRGHINLKAGETKIISFFRKKLCAFIYVLYNFAILHTDFIKDLGVFLFSKLYFHLYADCLFARAVEM
jgi:hypothetical protein